MAKLFLDIETIPAPEDEHETLKYLFQKKAEKWLKKKEMSDEVAHESNSIDKLTEFINNSTFDGSFGRILCIAYAIDNDDVKVICEPDNEAKMLIDFWTVANAVDQFVGHNVMDFDLRFIWQRSVKLKIRPSWRMDGMGSKCLSFARYRSYPIYDTMREWGKWSMGSVGLEHLALALGIPTPKQGIDGSQVFDFYKAGKIDEICEYCMRDVETTRQVYKRMVFAV